MNDDKPSDRSWSTAEAARRLGVSTPTVQKWVDLGHLQAWKTVGGHRRIDADSVERFLASRGGQAVARPASARADGPTVLIVDDNPDDRDVLQALVEQVLPGARITLAENGFEGLVAVGHAQPRVVVSDLVMPHMDGVAMLHHLRALPDGTPRVVIAVSSESAASLKRLGPLPHGVHFCAKPVDPAHFARCLHEGLAKAAAATVDDGS